MLIFLVNSTPVWSIAASINQLSDIADKLLCLKIWNQVDILLTASLLLDIEDYSVGNKNKNSKIRQLLL